MSYLSSTVPPHIMFPALQTFDTFITDTFLLILSPIVCSEDRLFRAKLKMSLPTPVGCGLTKTHTHCPFAWWSSVSLSLQDQLLFNLRAGLNRFASPAWNLMRETLGEDNSSSWSQIRHLLPDCAEGLTDGSLYSPLTANKGRLCSIV